MRLGIWQARKNLKRPCKIELRKVRENNKADAKRPHELLLLVSGNIGITIVAVDAERGGR
jgi:hypothetical protein